MKRVSDAFLPLLRKAGPGARLVHVSSGVAPNFVAACGPSRRAELTSPSVTWAEVDAAARAYLAAEAGAGGDAAAEAAALVAAGFPAKAGGGSLGPYGLSKALLNALTLQQARDEKEAGSGVVVAACSPGFIATDRAPALYFRAALRAAKIRVFSRLAPAASLTPAALV